MPSPEQLFGDLLASSAARPFVTYYDEATGERSELSVKSLANWVAKTHFLLIDELGLGVGDIAHIAVPLHWISVPVLLGTLSAGLELSDDPASAAVAFVSPETSALAAKTSDVYAVAPKSAAVGFGDAPPNGTADYVRAVRPQADAWASVRFGAVDSDPGWGGRSRDELVRAARERAEELGVAEGARVLVTRSWESADDWLDSVLVPLVVAGSAVYVVNAPDPAVLDRRADQERVSARI